MNQSRLDALWYMSTRTGLQIKLIEIGLSGHGVTVTNSRTSVLGRLLASPLFLGIRLLGHFERVIDFDTQISYGAL
jgi:hypothetical protein